IKYRFFFVPGGPVFEASPPMQKLVEKGNAVQASLLPCLKEAAIRDEVAYVLGRIGDKDAVPHLIECLPTDEKLTEDQEVSTMCLLQALAYLTGKSTGLGRFGLQYGPKVRKQWQEWHAANKDYFYSPAEPKPSSWGRPNVLVDVEAMIAGQPTVAYRKNHPRVKFDEIKAWAPGTGDARKLIDFCFSILRDSLNRDAVRSLGSLRDPRALETLHWLGAKAEDVDDCYDVIWT